MIDWRDGKKKKNEEEVGFECNVLLMYVNDFCEYDFRIEKGNEQLANDQFMSAVFLLANYEKFL